MKKCTQKSTKLSTGAGLLRRPTSSNKYRAIKTEIDGILFASRKEANRYSELKILERAGKITDLCLQVSFPLIIEGVKIATYICDFAYTENNQVIVEDCKGMKTATYKIKAKLMWALYRIKIFET